MLATESKYVRILPWTTDTELDEYLEDYSKSSFDRSTIGRRHVELWRKFCNSRSVLAFMMKFLNLPGPIDRDGVESKVVALSFDDCDFLQPDTTAADDGLYSSTLVDNIHCVLRTVARRAATLALEDSPDVVSLLLSTPHLDHLAAHFLFIKQKIRLSSLEYSKLGTIIQQSFWLKHVYLFLPFEGAPPAFFDALGNSIHLNTLRMGGCSEHREHHPRRQTLSNPAIGLDDQAIARLLHNPQNQLSKLYLSQMGLTDHHLMASLQFLPTSQIKEIDFRNNNIQAHGVLEFACHLPRNQSLKGFSIHNNPWEESANDHHLLGATFLQGITENTNIQFIDSLKHIPQAHLLWYYLLLNKAGRGRIFQASSFQEPGKGMPDGLWPYLLGHKESRFGFVSYDDFSQLPFNFRDDAKANIVYFILKNCPQVVSFR